jgi:hypothetical protein
MYRALNRRRVLDFVSGARRRQRPERQEPPEVVTFEGRITLEPPDDYDNGAVVLEVEESYKVSLVDYLFAQLEVPREDGSLPHVGFNGRITLEIHPDPDARWLLG